MHIADNMAKKLLLLLAFVISSCFFPCLCTTDHRYNAIFSFGDSLSDAGNLLVDGVPKELTTARPPYGMTFFGRPTGRCSDGRIVVDFLAEHFGLPLLPPSQSHKVKDFHKGANFAIIGATALERSYFEARGLNQKIWNTGSINTQIDWFKKTKPSLCDSEQACKAYFKKSLFVVGEFGGNDYNAPLFSGKTIDEVKMYVPDIVKAIGRGVEKLIEEGAMDLVVPGVLPIGCFPVYLTLYNSSNKADYNSRTGCLRKFNRIAFKHNLMLKQELDVLQQKYPKTRIMYGDYYTPAMHFVVNPAKFGFSSPALKVCCGAGGQGIYNFNLQEKCGEQGATACTNPSAYISWDGIHMTEAAYHKIAISWIKGHYADPPILK